MRFHVLFLVALDSHDNWTVEISFMQSWGIVFTKLVKGLIDFDIISQAAQAEMRNQLSWESGKGGNVTERDSHKQMQMEVPWETLAAEEVNTLQ
jgi:hypothetical protein